MRPGPSSTVLAAAASWECKVSSWLGGVVLADSIPATGRAAWTVTQQVPEALDLRVPRFSVEDGREVDWRPSSPDSPLARFGQVLDVTITAAGIDARLGRYLITDWKDLGGVIQVSAVGVLQLAADDRLPAPMAPRDGGTLKSETQRLLPSTIAAQFAAGLVDRACPKAMEWPEDRLGALYEIADAWPARLRTDSWGQVQFLAPLPADAVPVLSVTDGEGGTVVSAPTSDSRDRGYNRVVARSSADGVDAQGIAEVTSGPMSVTGPYGVVTRFFASPLLLTEAQCIAAAQSLLADAVRPTRTLQIEMAPDARIELDDAVEAITEKGEPTQSRDWGYVTGVDLPLTVSDGPARLNVAIF